MLISQEVAKIIHREIDLEDGVLATIVRVETSSTVEHAKVFISIFPPQKAEESFEMLCKRIGLIQGILNKTLNLRFVPKLMFELEKNATDNI